MVSSPPPDPLLTLKPGVSLILTREMRKAQTRFLYDFQAITKCKFYVLSWKSFLFISKSESGQV